MTVKPVYVSVDLSLSLSVAISNFPPKQLTYMYFYGILIKCKLLNHYCIAYMYIEMFVNTLQVYM